MTLQGKDLAENALDVVIAFAAGSIAFRFFGDSSETLMAQPISTLIAAGVAFGAFKIARKHKAF